MSFGGVKRNNEAIQIKPDQQIGFAFYSVLG